MVPLRRWSIPHKGIGGSAASGGRPPFFVGPISFAKGAYLTKLKKLRQPIENKIPPPTKTKRQLMSENEKAMVVVYIEYDLNMILNVCVYIYIYIS